MVENVIHRPIIKLKLREIIKWTIFLILSIGIIIACSLAISYTGILSPTATKDVEGSNTSRMYSYRHERLKSALTIMENIDESVDPCDNFYKFACGNFLNRTELPKHQNQVNKFVQGSNRVFNRLHQIFDEINATYTENRSFNLAKNLYDICMDSSGIEEIKLKTLEKLLETLNSRNWPIQKDDNWNDTTFTWEEFIHDIKLTGIPGHAFTLINVMADPKNNSRYVIEMDQPFLEFRKDQFSKGLNSSAMIAYHKYMSSIAGLLGNDRANTSYELTEIIKFEMQLSQISAKPEVRRNGTAVYNPTAKSEMNKNYPGINWDVHLDKLFKHYGVKLNDNDTIILTNISFLSSLERLISETPKRVLKNFAVWRVIQFSVPYLDSEMRKIFSKYDSTLRGSTTIVSTPTWVKCVDTVKKSLQLSTDAMYLRHIRENKPMKAEIQKIKEYVTGMVENIHKQLINILNSIEWFDFKTKLNAVNKAKAIHSIVAYPDELFDGKKLDKYYEKLELENGDFLQSMLNVNLFRRGKLYSSFRNKHDRKDWTTLHSIIDVNAFNMFRKNSIMILTGILEDAFFNSNRPSYLNYGSIGTIIGHEFFHSFDDQGQLYDKHGNLYDWWSDRTKKIFHQKAKCFIQQYSNYTIEGTDKKMNGIISQGENIADSNGARISYMAYKQWAATRGPEAKLPELPYTAVQLFWISLANNWCSVDSTQWLMDSSARVHPPGQLRVTGLLSNIPEFANDFQCPVGSPMNPPQRCTLW